MSNGQTKTHSAVEITTNLVVGLLLSVYLIQPIIFRAFDVTLGHSENWIMAIMFTAVSWVRGYIVRRGFNWIMLRRVAYGV